MVVPVTWREGRRACFPGDQAPSLIDINAALPCISVSSHTCSADSTFPWLKIHLICLPLLRRLGVSSLSLREVGLEPPYEPCTYTFCAYQERSRRIAPPSSIHSQHTPLCRKTRATDKHLPRVIKHNKSSNSLVSSYYVIKCTDQNYFCQVLLSKRSFLSKFKDV